MTEIYRSIPVLKQAVQLTALNMAEVKEWVPGSSNWYNKDKDSKNLLMGLTIPTLEGDHQASFGDFIIQGLKGEFYPCKADVFYMSYEPASAPPTVPDFIKVTLAYQFGVIDAVAWKLRGTQTDLAESLAHAVVRINHILGDIVSKEENASK